MRILTAIARVFWKELIELRQKPLIPLGIVAVSLLFVWTSGQINLKQANAVVNLYKGGVGEAALNKVRTILKDFAHIQVQEIEGNLFDANSMRAAGASLAIVHRDGNWLLLHRFATARQEDAASPLMGLLAYALGAEQPLSALLLDPDQRQADSLSMSRMSALPGEPQVELVPRTIALMVAFLPFVLIARSYSREVAFGTLPILLSLPHSGWRSMALGKIAACMWIVLVVLLIVLLAVHFFFGLNPKSGLIVQLAVQTVAIFISACLGLLFATLARNQSQVYLFTSVYFLILVLVSGFLFSLETAAPLVQIASHFSPLTFSGKILENWLFFGTSALVFMPDVSFLLAQALIAATLLTCSIFFARRRV
jgi:ABC-type transport system involved in multi-copper enzyme maturation permease subunit